MPQVSIIMPCHNGERFVANAIKSVSAQTFADWELLVINDASVDNTVAIVSEFCKNDSRIKLLHTEKSTGLPATPRNVGIANASGRYIAFLDCDDQWYPTKLERQIPIFSDREVAVVLSYYNKMDANGRPKENSTVKSPATVDFPLLLKGNCIANLTGVYDTQKVGKVFQQEIHHEDYLMWLEILQKGFVAVNTNTCEACYRVYANSVSANKIKVMKWHWNIYRKNMRISFGKSLYLFVNYLFRAVLKFLK